MRKLSRFIALIGAALMIVPQGAISVYAEENAVASYEYVIWDDADLLSDAEEEMLYYDLEPLLEYGNVIFNSCYLAPDTDYEQHSEQIYYEYFGNEPGINFQIDMCNRKLTLSASTGMEDLIHDERDSIVDNVYQMASDENYYGCVSECFKEVFAVINDGKIAHRMKYVNNALVAIMCALLLNYLLAFVTTTQKSVNATETGIVDVTVPTRNIKITEGKRSKEYSPVSSDSGSSGGGGGGGGGFSGGSSSHGF